MGNIQKILTTLIFLLTTTFTGTYVHAHEDLDLVQPSKEIQTEEETEENTQAEQKEEQKEEEKKETTKVTSKAPEYSFGTLLLAILIPSILIVIAYLIFKFVKF